MTIGGIAVTKQTVILVLVVAIVCVGVTLLATGQLPNGANAPVATSTSPTPSAPGAGSTHATTAPTPTSKTAAPITPQQAASTPPKLVGYGSIYSLLTRDNVLVCSITSATPHRTGTLYVYGKKFRADVSAVVNGQSITAHMIDDSSYFYVWVNGLTLGLKLSATVTANGSVTASRGGIDPATDVSYACRSWTPIASYFIPPSSVTFTDTQGN